MRGDQREIVNATAVPLLAGHGGGDERLLFDAIAHLRARRDELPGSVVEARTSLAVSLESHAMAFAAETSRREGRVVVLPAGR
jgi:hypothetical protein